MAKKQKAGRAIVLDKESVGKEFMVSAEQKAVVAFCINRGKYPFVGYVELSGDDETDNRVPVSWDAAGVSNFTNFTGYNIIGPWTGMELIPWDWDYALLHFGGTIVRKDETMQMSIVSLKLLDDGQLEVNGINAQRLLDEFLWVDFKDGKSVRKICGCRRVKQAQGSLKGCLSF